MDLNLIVATLTAALVAWNTYLTHSKIAPIVEQVDKKTDAIQEHCLTNGIEKKI